MHKVIESHRFICTVGSASKQYTHTLEERDGVYVVAGNYGPIGGRISPAPVTPCKDLEDAQKKLAAEIKRRLKKDYVPDGEGTAAVVAEIRKDDTGLRPQLLSPIDRDQLLALIDDDAWGFQEKKNGDRRMARKCGSEVAGANRQGFRVPVHPALEARLGGIAGDYVFDGELVNDVLHVFDLLEDRGEDLRALGFIERYERLADRFIGDDNVRIVPLAVGAQAKRELLAYCEKNGLEGVVAKRLDAPHSVGKSAGTQVKCKFWNSASCVVSAHNEKRSIALEMFDKNGMRVFVGNVTVKANQQFPPIGSIIEVKYLDVADEGGCLNQPQFIAVRDDIGTEDCTTAQLKYKAKAA